MNPTQSLKMGNRETEMSLVYLFLLSLLSISCAKTPYAVGVNYGLLGNNLPPPSRSIELIRNLKAGSVKLYGSNPEILKALAGTKLYVTIMVPNQEISHIASNQTVADEWVRTNILPFQPGTRIRSVLVGNEIFSYYSEQDRQTWYDLVPAILRIKRSLKTHNVRNIKLGTTCAMDVLQSAFPPSSGTFRPDISIPVIKPLLQFLNRTKSSFFIDAYTYFAWSASPATISLDYALLKEGSTNYTDPGSGLTYTNLLDQMLDAIIFAMRKLGFPDVMLSVAETGWPNAGDIDEIGANINNAATFNRNLIRRMTAKPAVGTPARPSALIPTFIFSLFDENQKVGPGTERHWGLFYPNGSGTYELDLAGNRMLTEYPPLPAALNNEPYRGDLWCVVARGVVNTTELVSALTYACSHGNGTCDPIRPGKECYEPVSLYEHAYYAFNAYWVQFRSTGASCYFNGLAVQTATDPSHGSCKFPSVSV